ncbi:thioredoxin-dependent thiol peroxidase [candidate division KSB1 bacterium]|nr:thioredoxin-dependent thiol peroxidase [candidate division KSB1 bacterium]
MLKPGDKAPDFTLASDEGKQISLSDYAGKSDVVLYFYPKDNTSGCTAEACSFRDNFEEITTRNAKILGISPDSIKSHQNFIRKHDLNFTLLSDPDHKVAEVYGAWGEKKMYGKSYQGILRTTFVIGKDGLIKHVFEKVKVDGHVEQVLEIL